MPKKKAEKTTPAPLWAEGNLPALTIAICALIAAVFASFSSGGIFATGQDVSEHELSVDSPQNILLYIFQHAGYAHLIGNLAVILAAGAILESTLGKKDILILFFGASIFAGALFAALNPGNSIIGASAGAIALLTAAFILHPKKAILGFAVMLGLGYIAIFGINYWVGLQKEQISSQAEELTAVREIAIWNNDAALAQKTGEKLSEKKAALEKIAQGQAISGIPPSFEIHFFSSLFAFAYLLAFRKKEVMQSMGKNWAPAFRRIGIS